MLASALAAGFVGTLVLTTVLRAASELGLTRMDLPFLLGTSVSDNRRRAKVYGYVFHFIIGLIFGVAYAAFFASVGRSGAALGAALGAVHAIFISTVVIPLLLPILHPRIGTPETAANEIALLEPPGFMMLNYGRNSFLVTLVSHVAYGAILGWAVRI